MRPDKLRDMVPRALRREWVRSGYYPDKDVYALFHDWAVLGPEGAAVVDDAGTTTYAELDIAARRVAAGMRNAGVQPGDVVGIQLPNCWQACAVELGLAAAGAIALPYPLGRGERDVCSLLGRSEAVGAIIWGSYEDEDYPAMMRSIRSQLPALAHIFVFEPRDLPNAGLSSLDAMIADGDADEDWEPPCISADGPVRILVTSGTEAAPKMVLYSHNALAGGRGNFIGALKGDRKRMRSFFMVPLASAFGSSATSVSVARHGATLILTRKYSSERAIAGIDSHRPTHLLGVPAMFDMLLSHPELDAVDVSSVNVVAVGGSALSPSTIDDVRRKFDSHVVNVWGTGDGANCHTRLDDPLEKISATVGRPNPAVADIRILDGDGHPLPLGAQGEICALGPMSAMCYYNSPDLDSLYRTSGGWLKTGDLGVIDSEGYLRFLARKKDVIIRGGENISPATIENALQAHPDVQQAACVGMPDTVLGERICAYVVLRSGASTPPLEELSTFLLAERGLSKTSLPERVEVITDMPFNPAGKVLKRDLRDRIAERLVQDSQAS